ASYRLAWLLVHHWWLRQMEMAPDVFARLVQQDVQGQPAARAEDRVLPLTYEGLRDFALRVAVGGTPTHWDGVEEEAGRLRRAVEDGKYDDGRDDPLPTLERRHEQRLQAEAEETGEVGLAYRVMVHNRRLAERELEARVRQLFDQKLQRHGVRGA